MSNEATVILSFYQGVITNRAKVSSHDIDTDADRSMVHVSRDLYDSDELRAVRLFSYQARAYVKQRSRPSFFRNGMYAVKLEHVEEVLAHLEAQVPELMRLTEAFISVMPQRQQEAKEKQGTLYREEDYPSGPQIRDAVKWEWRVMTLDTPTSLRTISESFFQKEQEKAQRQMAAMVEAARETVRVETMELVQSLLKSLQPDADGKVKAFRAPVVTKVEKFFDLLRYRDTEDPEIAPLLKRLRSAMNGVDAKDVREDDEYRTALAGTFDRLRVELEGLVAVKPKRAIDLSDDAAE